jgi:hypothetical protein
MAHSCPAIRYRVATEIFPDLLSPAELETVRAEIELYPGLRQVIRKQKDTGVWGGNLLGVSPNKTQGIKDVGTIHQFRRLVEWCAPGENRAFRLATRLLFRLLSRDDDPKLLFEFQKYGAAEQGTEPWIRTMLREAAAAALAHAGLGEDPRVRGAAHRIANDISQFLRSDLAEEACVKSGRQWVLHPQAHPPSIFSISLFGHLPAVQRERAGLMERLGTYLARPAPKHGFVVACGKKTLKPGFLLLGDPVQISAAGQTRDLPFALFWLETLARLGALPHSTSAPKLWSRLLKDCDEQGVWRPKNLRSVPKRVAPWSYHAFPLEVDTKRQEARQTDVVFRMALIGRLAGWELTRS